MKMVTAGDNRRLRSGAVQLHRYTGRGTDFEGPRLRPTRELEADVESWKQSRLVNAVYYGAVYYGAVYHDRVATSRYVFRFPG